MAIGVDRFQTHEYSSSDTNKGIRRALVFPAINAALIAGDFLTTQLYFNVSQTNAAHSESSIIGRIGMHDSNSVFTPELILESGFSRLAYATLPFMALNHVADKHKNNKNSFAYYGPKGIAYAWGTSATLSSVFPNINNTWNILNKEGILPTPPPWNDALQYYVANGHMFDPLLEGFMRYWDLADYTGLGLVNFTLLNAGITALATTGAIIARKQYKKSHQRA